ncbi:low-specificity L-threonine aldolase [Alkalibacter mobilis]|uniref:low-specificity L-threonine aldolase n=1 Tax=Alkalibacter mobilis TaxID=2787712 RepID=UPI00189C7DF8|nr:low-specificity L-threonine aldolase [Alkalibacter mobilis]MBF7095788.1 low-specificity L-threonine aldolase [Alkalibacter mobilis]
MKVMDYRSDTITKPTEVMRKAMYEAEVGDDVYREDPTIKKLEELGAQMTGKEKALFVPSGTMGNQIAVKVHTHHGDEVILEENCHIHTYEVGGISAISGVQSKQITSDMGTMRLQDIKDAVRAEDIHFPVTSLICMENTHNKCGGTVSSKENMEEIYEFARTQNIKVHLDGARIFNASTYLGVQVSELTMHSDSVMFCLSKGLCAPVGSLLAGDADFIERSRRVRKMLGGGIRQGGVLAAAGIVALTEMTNRLQEDHDNALSLAKGLKDINGLDVNMDTVMTNIVMCDITDENINVNDLKEGLKHEGILVSPISPTRLRFVLHYYITTEDVKTTIEKTSKVIKTI